MRLAIICRPFSFHGGVETATAGLLGELIRRGHRIDLVSTPGSARCPRGHRAATPRAGPALRAPAPVLRARRAPRRRGGGLRHRAEPRALPPPGRLPRGRGDASRLSRGDGSGPGESLPPPRPRLRAADLHASNRAARGGHLAPRRRGDRPALRHPTGSPERRVQRGRPRPLSSRSLRALPPSDARGARPVGPGLAGPVRGVGLRAERARPADRGAGAARRPARGPRRGGQGRRHAVSAPGRRPRAWGVASTGSGRGRTSSGSTRWPTPWRCPRATSRSATCTSKRSRRGCPC